MATIIRRGRVMVMASVMCRAESGTLSSALPLGPVSLLTVVSSVLRKGGKWQGQKAAPQSSGATVESRYC